MYGKSMFQMDQGPGRQSQHEWASPIEVVGLLAPFGSGFYSVNNAEYLAPRTWKPQGTHNLDDRFIRQPPL